MIKIEKFVEKEHRKKSRSLFKGCLYLAGAVYEGIIFCRHQLYSLGLKKSVKAELPVISVGNIVCGGTGKTELVSKIYNDPIISIIKDPIPEPYCKFK